MFLQHPAGRPDLARQTMLALGNQTKKNILRDPRRISEQLSNELGQKREERHLASRSVRPMVAGAGFEPATFGL